MPYAERRNSEFAVASDRFDPVAAGFYDPVYVFAPPIISLGTVSVFRICIRIVKFRAVCGIRVKIIVKHNSVNIVIFDYLRNAFLHKLAYLGQPRIVVKLSVAVENQQLGRKRGAFVLRQGGERGFAAVRFFYGYAERIDPCVKCDAFAVTFTHCIRKRIKLQLSVG